MTDFWGNADGDEKKAFMSGFAVIPDGTEAIAQVDKAEFDETGKFGPLYQITWKIVDGQYTNRLIFQSIGVFDQDQVRAERAKNMLMYLFKMFNIPLPSGAPTTGDLMPMVGRLAQIKIGEWTNKEGKTKNVINEIHATGNDIQEKAAFQMSSVESAFSRNTIVTGGPDDGIPF